MDAASIFKKLKFDDTKRSLIINAYPEYETLLAGKEYDKGCDQAKASIYDFIQLFATSQSELETLVTQVHSSGKYDCLFWICYPKQSGKTKSDIKRDTAWKAFEIANLRPVSQIALDETWSALRGRPFDKAGH